MSVLDQPRLEPDSPPRAPARDQGRRRRRFRWALGAVALLAGAWAVAPYAVQLEPSTPSLPAGSGLMVPGYGPGGTYALDYRYGEAVTVSLPLVNDSAVPWRITSVELVEPAFPLLEPVGVTGVPETLGPFGEVTVNLSFEFTHCRYYHERANNSYDQVRVTGTVLGREVTRTVDLATPLMVHSQVILNCPERTLVRGDDRRV